MHTNPDDLLSLVGVLTDYNFKFFISVGEDTDRGKVVQNDQGIIRNSVTTQLKYVVTGAALATTQAAFQTDGTSFFFAQPFSAPPTVYVANINPNGNNPIGDIDKVLITLHNYPKVFVRIATISLVKYDQNTKIWGYSNAVKIITNPYYAKF